MKIYELKTNLAGSADQPKLIELLQQQKIEFIQTASGLCVKSPLAKGEMGKLVGAVGPGFSLTELAKEEETRPDVMAFLKE